MVHVCIEIKRIAQLVFFLIVVFVHSAFGLIFQRLSIGVAFVASVVGGVVTLSNLILGVCGGPLLGVFLLGMLTERAGPQSGLVVGA